MSHKLVLCLCLALSATALHAQDPEGVRLGLLYQPEYQPGFVVLPFAATGGAGTAAGSIEQIIRTDLDYADRFEMRQPSGVAAGSEVNLALWKERGADWVLDGTVSPRAGGLSLRLVLHDAVYGQVKQDQVFNLPAPGAPNFRIAVHAVADEVVRWATGDPGIAATRIAFVLEGRGSKEIYVVDYDGENVQRITNDGSTALSPAWSPDGTRIAYTSFRNGMPWLYERTLGSGADRIISDRDGVNFGADYSPDGQLIAFSTTVEKNTEVATFNRARNCCLQQQTRGRRFDSLSPTFSPEGDRLAFVSNRLGEPHIYLMPLAGEANLISDYSYGGKRGYNTSPDWAPRGGKIAYQSILNGQHQIVMYDLEKRERRLLTNEGNNEDPSWAPDGRHLVFASKDREGGGLFVLDTVSGRVRPLLRGSGYGLPDWSSALYRATAPAR